VVEDALRSEVVESRRFGVELHAHDLERLSFDQTYLWKNSEGFGGVLQDLKVDWSIAGVVNLYSLIHTLVWPARWEEDLVLWSNLNHWNERLTSWREGMSN
jgi:hypothetical protein